MASVFLKAGGRCRLVLRMLWSLCFRKCGTFFRTGEATSGAVVVKTIDLVGIIIIFLKKNKIKKLIETIYIS